MRIWEENKRRGGSRSRVSLLFLIVRTQFHSLSLALGDKEEEKSFLIFDKDDRRERESCARVQMRPRKCMCVG